MPQTLIAIKAELETLFNAGMSLRDISQATYKKREADKNFPYFSISDTREGLVVRLDFSPIAKQKELTALRQERAPDSKALLKYRFWVGLEGVHLEEATGKIGGVMQYKQL